MIKLKSSVTYSVERSAGKELLLRLQIVDPTRHIAESRPRYFTAHEGLIHIAKETLHFINTYQLKH